MTHFPKIEQPDDRKIFRWLILFTILIHSAGLIQFTIQAIQQGFLPGSRNWTIAVVVNAVLILLEILGVYLIQTPFYPKIRSLPLRIASLVSRLRWLNLLFSLTMIVAFTYLVLNPNGRYIPIPFTRWFLFWLTVLSVCLFLKAWSLQKHPHSHLRWFHWLGLSFLITAFGYMVFSFYSDISRYPYTLTWSETSRYYYASLFFSEKIYGMKATPTVLHPSRYLLQSLPFLLSQSPLVLHRAWQVFLWLSITLLTAFFMSRRSTSNNNSSLLKFLTLAWAFIFLLVGPVYYHLQIPLILILWGFNRSKSPSPQTRFAQNLIIVAIASAWAGISRVNWFPVPGLLAATLIFIEQPFKRSTPSQGNSAQYSPKLLSWSSIQYGLKPVGWTILGTAIAFAAQNLYIYWSGNSSKDFTSSFSSDLLWYRLLPSSTYPLGILLGAILISWPLCLMIWSKLYPKESANPYWKQVHPIRLMGLLSILFVLFAGGLVVSVKIGGGSNLHNLDAYMSILLITTLMIGFNRLVPDQVWNTRNAEIPVDEDEQESIQEPVLINLRGKIQSISLVLCLLIPTGLVLISKGPAPIYPPQETIDRGLSATVRAIESLQPGNKDVLFLTNRHWLTFGYIKDITLIPEYERVFLMEMAMANQAEYLERFHQDLANHRFELIISEPIYLTEKSQELRFAEENNAWVKRVSETILCYYKPRTTIKLVNIQILIPRENASDCD